VSAGVKVSDHIVSVLARHGLECCFAVTGGGAMHLNDSFGHDPRFRCVYPHHEQACAMAAEGYARVTGTPAVVCVTSGPGTTNAITGVLGAWLDSVPMVVISGQMKLETTLWSTPLPLRQLGFQEFNIIDSVRPLTKYAAMITDARYVTYHLEKALHLARSGRQGPVWLDIPLDIQGARINPEEQVRFDLGDGDDDRLYRRTVHQDTVDEVLRMVNAARRPVALLGYGVRMSASEALLAEALDRLRIPVVTEWNSNDLVWNAHPYFAGRPGTIGDRGGNFVLQGADLVLALGCQFSIRQVSYAWRNFARNARVVAVNVDKYELLKPTVRIDVPLHADVGDFLGAVARSGVAPAHGPGTSWHAWCRAISARYPVVIPERHLVEGRPLSAYAFFGALSRALDGRDTVVLANGAACVVGLQALEVREGQRVFTNAGASSMGYGVTAAIGAAVARGPGRRVVCVEGDGSIQMNLQELQTIVHHGLDIKLFWINNDGYHSIKQTQNALFRGRERGLCGADRTSGISFPDAGRIAAAYRLPFVRIDALAGLEEGLACALGTEGPLLCEVVTDPDEEFVPKLQSKLLEDGTFETPSLEDMYPFLGAEEMRQNRFPDS
jgi:acetolactate synthase-1/2/3 large subunit